MAISGGGDGKKGTPSNPIELKGVVIKAKPYARQDSTTVGGVKQSMADVAKAVATLNKSSMANVGDSPDLSGKNSSSDNVNLMIAKRNQIKSGGGSQ